MRERTETGFLLLERFRVTRSGTTLVVNLYYLFF